MTDMTAAPIAPLLLAYEAAEILRVGPRTLRRLVVAGELRVVNVGTGARTVRIDPDSVRAFIERRSQGGQRCSRCR